MKPLNASTMLTVIEKVLLLQDIDFFFYAYSEHLAQLASISNVVKVGKDSILFREGEQHAEFHLLVTGQVLLEMNGKEICVAEQDGLDYWSFFSETPHQFTARTLEDCMLLVVSYENMVDLLTAEPEFSWAILKHLARLGRLAPAAAAKEQRP